MARQQEGGQRRSSPLPPRERRGREAEEAGGEPEVIEHSRGARLEIGSAEGQVALEREGVPVFGSRPGGGKCLAGRLEFGGGLGDTGPASQVVGQGFGAVGLGLLRQVRDRRARRRHHDISRIGRLDPGQDLQKSRLSDPVRTDDADAMLGTYGEIDVGEDSGGPAILRDPVGNDGDSRSGKRVGHDDLRVVSGGRGLENGDQICTAHMLLPGRGRRRTSSGRRLRAIRDLTS